MTQRIKRFSIGQSAKFLGVLYLLLGLLFVPFFLFLEAVAPENTVPFGALFAFAMPLMYSVVGLVSGAIGAALYNMVAHWIGGIEVEIDAA